MKNPQPETREHGQDKSAHESRRADQPYATEVEDHEREREHRESRATKEGRPSPPPKSR
jgi:hypothetical protein